MYLVNDMVVIIFVGLMLERVDILDVKGVGKVVGSVNCSFI